MNFKSFILRLFGKKINSRSRFLTTTHDNIIIPKKNELTFEDLNNFKGYKQEYEATLSRNKIVFVSDLTSNEINTSKSMYIDLFLNLYNEETTKIIDIKILKLNIYLDSISKLKTECLLRLKALKEIFLLRPFISKSTRSSIKEEISNLEVCYLIFKNQEEHACREIETFKRENEVETEISLMGLEKYYSHLYKQAIIVIPNIVKELGNKNTDVRIQIAYLETELEKYVYKNRDKVLELNDEIASINAQNITSKNRDSLLGRIKELETYYKIFYYFTRDLVSNNELYNLYELKLYLLSFDMFSNWYKHLETYNGLAPKIYVKIIENIFYNLVMGYNEELENAFKEDTDEATLLIKNLCRNEAGKIDFDYVLRNEFLLVLLLQSTKQHGIENYFNNYLFNSPYKEKRYSYMTLEFNDYISIGLDILVKSFEKEALKDRIDLALEKLYSLLKKHLITNVFKIPEGIKEVNITDANKVFESINNYEKPSIYRSIVDYFSDQTVILPNSLKKLNGILFESNRIVLNQGIENIVNLKIEGDVICLPSSIKSIYGGCIRGNKVFLNDGLKTVKQADIDAEFLSISSSIQIIVPVTAPLKNVLYLNRVKILEFRDYLFNEYLLNTLVNSNQNFSIGKFFQSFLSKTIHKNEIYLNDCIERHVGDNVLYQIPLNKVLHLDEIRFLDYRLNDPIILKKDDLMDIKVSYYKLADYDVLHIFESGNILDQAVSDILKIVTNKHKALKKIKKI